jgi:hypothetical protein
MEQKEQQLLQFDLERIVFLVQELFNYVAFGHFTFDDFFRQRIFNVFLDSRFMDVLRSWHRIPLSAMKSFGFVRQLQFVAQAFHAL